MGRPLTPKQRAAREKAKAQADKLSPEQRAALILETITREPDRYTSSELGAMLGKKMIETELIYIERHLGVPLQETEDNRISRYDQDEYEAWKAAR